MTPTILEKIIARKRIRVEEAKRDRDLGTLVSRAEESKRYRRNFRAAISQADRINIVAEFKRSSPSKGVINESRDPDATARLYKDGGACAISVLTEEDFFQGSLEDLRAVRGAVDLPVLRKDFIIEEYQIYESAAVGADAILLIVAALTSENLHRFQTLAQEVGLEAVVEVHDLEELETAISADAKIIGANNRDLRTFEVSLDVSRDLIEHVPADALVISESGLKTRDDLIELRNLGYSAFLIGETLMRSGNPVQELKELATEVQS
ncbi:MAG TPA: indole-3-glycerol phosphate synthase TrpC [Pyrinomonadaceae bacterium]|nr:indole-3-glycerol phosphate synthase TrpC [Pyrinomonadaceae bacterium]